MTPSVAAETVGEFRLRARTWLANAMPHVNPDSPPNYRIDSIDAWDRARELQRQLYHGGFAGICFPREYGGLGLTVEYQRAFDDETGGYELPYLLNVPSLAICSATILDMGSEEQKRAHIAAAIRGEEVLAQLLSEPGAGSDLASVATRAELKQGSWVLNGSKIWSTAAFSADYGLCLTRTDWSVPKHEGLTMFLVKIDQPGVTVRRIVEINGSTEFCEVFLDNVQLPTDAVLGELNNGWTVATRQLYHERRAMGGGSEFASGIDEFPDSNRSIGLPRLARKLGKLDDARTRTRIGRVYAQWVVHDQLIPHVMAKVAAGELPETAGTIIRLSVAETEHLANDAAVRIAGPGVVVAGAEDSDDEAVLSHNFVSRQIISIGGGTTEMARNVISERILKMPREPAADRGIPFSQVSRNRTR
jgi:alkylation response protein AidB-like acyl-CoA dehydrogenase